MKQKIGFRKTEAGFSLVEIMVGLVIGLLAMLVVTQVYSTFEGQKRTTTAGSDAQTNGALGLYTLSRDVQIAGYGFANTGALNCKINRSYNGTTLTPMSMVPVTITDGANGAPDSIEILASSNSAFSIPARVTVDHPAQADNFFIDSTVGMHVNDLLVAYQPGLDCTLLQVTGIPNGNVQIHHQNTSPWDPPGGQNIFPPGGYTAGAQLFNLGSLTDHIYSVASAAKGGLQLSVYDSSTNTSSTQIVVPDIVNLQAQYGKDEDGNGQIDDWDNDTPTSASDWQQVIAVRVALVARSAQWEKAVVTTGSTATWAGGTLHLDNNPDGTANPDWAHYRYRVFETTIPLRNMIWKQ